MENKSSYPPLSIHNIHGYTVVTGGTYAQYFMFFTDTDQRVYYDYSMKDLESHTHTQYVAYFALNGRFYETVIPLNKIETYISSLNATAFQGD